MPHLNRSCFYLLSYMFSEARYNIVNNPLVYPQKTQNAFLSFAFDDSGENVWIAAHKIPSTDMEHIVNQVKEIVHDTLDLPVHINAILIQPTDKPTQTQKISYAQSQKNIQASAKDSYMLIFKTLAQAEEYLMAHPNQIPEDVSHLPATLSYYEAIVTYLNTEFACAK